MLKDVFIIGGAQTDFQRNFAKEGKSFLAMMREAIIDTMTKTKINFSEINKLRKANRISIFVGNFNGEQYLNQGHLAAFFSEIAPEFTGIPAARYEAACASGAVAIDTAITKINAGEIDLAIVLGIEMMKTADPIKGGDFLGAAAFYEEEAKGVSFPFPKLFAQLAEQTQKKYNFGKKEFYDALAEISRINYDNAKRNPNAQTRSWFMNKTHASQRNTDFNPPVGGTLCITDCSQVTDGAACIVLASKDFAKKHSGKYKTKNTFPKIKGRGFRVAPILFETKMTESSKNQYILPWTRQTVLDAYKEAELGVSAIDVFETHDCFTSSEFMAISAFGITKPGREIEAIERGIIDFDGKKPINPSGGLIGVGHPVGATGVRMLLDLYKQISRQAGDYQIDNVQNAAMLNIGGSATTNIVFIVGK
ncbi:thiolase domain-containing protein [Candidatus Dojkabacteria bacterium]|nr:thiolase domain-containing protein [Candidatus Dojkabacteria bacterium]